MSNPQISNLLSSDDVIEFTLIDSPTDNIILTPGSICVPLTSSSTSSDSHTAPHQNTITSSNDSITVHPTQSTIVGTVAKTTGSMALYAAKTLTTSSIGRKAIFTGTMYLAGGAVISTVGIVPVLVTGAIIWIL